MSFKTSLLSASSALAIGLIGQGLAVQAADVVNEPVCAVSAVNGKVEAIGGYSENDHEDGDALISGLGSLSFPLGCDFGLQADIGVIDELDRTTYGGAVHLFTRDPESYLLGMTGGYFNSDGSDIWAIGPEAEFYLGQFSLEAWGGYVDFESDDDLFGFVDAAFYPSDDLRLSVGATIIGDQEFLRGRVEYQFADPMSFSVGAKVGEEDYVAITGGLSFYFGGEGKSLIRRHREDDPRNRILDFQGFHEDSNNSGTPTSSFTFTGTPG